MTGAEVQLALHRAYCDAARVGHAWGRLEWSGYADCVRGIWHPTVACRVVEAVARERLQDCPEGAHDGVLSPQPMAGGFLDVMVLEGMKDVERVAHFTPDYTALYIKRGGEITVCRYQGAYTGFAVHPAAVWVRDLVEVGFPDSGPVRYAPVGRGRVAEADYLFSARYVHVPGVTADDVLAQAKANEEAAFADAILSALRLGYQTSLGVRRVQVAAQQLLQRLCDTIVLSPRAMAVIRAMEIEPEYGDEFQFQCPFVERLVDTHEDGSIAVRLQFLGRVEKPGHPCDGCLYYGFMYGGKRRIVVCDRDGRWDAAAKVPFTVRDGKGGEA